MPPRIPPSTTTAIAIPSPHTHCRACLQRSFSTTPQARARVQIQTKLRRQMWIWLNTSGKNFVQPNELNADKTNYLTSYLARDKFATPFRARAPSPEAGPDTEQTNELEEAAVGEEAEGQKRRTRDEQPYPFPMNKEFKSQSILSEALRLEIWKRVQVEKQSVRQVSSDLGVEMRRVGAVVRLVEVEKRMRAQGQDLALPYAEAIHSMVETTPYTRGQRVSHESINDLPHHALTAPQLFYPTSESRAFNRTDAGRVFSAAPRLPDSQDVGQGGAPLAEPWADTRPETIGKKGYEMHVLKPADARIPHPHLIKHEQDKRDPNISIIQGEARKRYEQRLRQDQERRQIAQTTRAEKAEERKTRIAKGRWDFVFEDVVADRGVGEKYGVPSQDRKRGSVKIPTRVEV
ncbi:uncharacterized protein HMPREF1541_05230 [Cyphellophora europaea CBS 101466]|uniref:Eukaryotic mitochondrial regulator protein-domain-containing protein n=1 Tax=Cyphellophora europaea (strain CBS 101466) TaxID=1220924 RepID=W2RXB6_CYPE1|nr:uncharacterized protein HMPREF1541_05230 [Cyphellophora europaea CBS 101466]ETN40950.1 hypothetical protein HMPREF1541_05230 [Cyphellophora europaea CBS 101466]